MFIYYTSVVIWKMIIIVYIYSFKKLLLERNDDYHDYMKDRGESIFEKIVNIKMEQYFVTMFEDLRRERSIISSLSLTDPDISKQCKFTDY